jgi:hypothetical protein
MSLKQDGKAACVSEEEIYIRYVCFINGIVSK